MAHGDRMTVTIAKWGRKVIIHNRRKGSKFDISADKNTVTIEYPDDELRGPRSKKSGAKKKKP